MLQETRVLHPVRRRGWKGWFAVRKRHLGYVAFALNRLTGLGLVLYLIIHLVVLSLLARGPETWDAFIKLAKSPAFLLLDVILLAGILFHGLNGLRVILVGLGIGVHRHKELFWGLMLLAAILLIFGAWGFLVV